MRHKKILFYLLATILQAMQMVIQLPAEIAAKVHTIQNFGFKEILIQMPEMEE